MELEEMEKEKKKYDMDCINETKLVEMTMMGNAMNDNSRMEVFKNKYTKVDYEIDENIGTKNIVNKSTFK